MPNNNEQQGGSGIRSDDSASLALETAPTIHLEDDSAEFNPPTPQSPHTMFHNEQRANSISNGQELDVILRRLQENDSTLFTVDLRGKNIQCQGAIDLANSLTRNTTLTQLLLSHNTIGSEGAVALATALTDNKTLEVLEVQVNSIGTEGSMALAKCVESCLNLTKFRIDFNPIGTEGAVALGACVAACSENRGAGKELQCQFGDNGDSQEGLELEHHYILSLRVTGFRLARKRQEARLRRANMTIAICFVLAAAVTHVTSYFNVYWHGISTIFFITSLFFAAATDLDFDENVRRRPFLAYGFHILAVILITGRFLDTLHYHGYFFFLFPALPSLYFLIPGVGRLSLQAEKTAWYITSWATTLIWQVGLFHFAFGACMAYRAVVYWQDPWVFAPFTESLGTRNCSLPVEGEPYVWWPSFTLGLKVCVVDMMIVIWVFRMALRKVKNRTQMLYLVSCLLLVCQGQMDLVIAVFFQDALNTGFEFQEDCMYNWLGFPDVIAMHSVVNTILPLYMFLSRKGIWSFVASLVNRRHRLENGAFLAHLLVDSEPRELLCEARARLRRVPISIVTIEHLRCSGTEQNYSLSSSCSAGEIDFFITHSWQDDPEQKFRALEQLGLEFKRKHGREAYVWLDSICLNCREIAQDLRCLPVYIMACRKMAVLLGRTYPQRMWCAWELYTFLAIAPDLNKIVIKVLHDSNDLTGATMASLRDQLSQFEVENAVCTHDEDRRVILRIIKAGGAQHFNSIIRSSLLSILGPALAPALVSDSAGIYATEEEGDRVFSVRYRQANASLSSLRL